MTTWPLDILPLIDRLAQDKPLAQGLWVGHWVGSGAPDHGAGVDAAAYHDWPYFTLDQLLSLPFSQRYDLAVVCLSTDDLSADDLSADQPLAAAHCQAITRLRDLLARRILLLATAQHSATLRALGFSCIESGLETCIESGLKDDTASPPATEWQIWQFNILSYKQAPDWLNAKYWANPENFGKYRW